MTKETRGWMISTVVLGVVVLILLGMTWHNYGETHKDLYNVLKEGNEDVAEARADIEQFCRGAEANTEKCDQSITKLVNVLSELSADIDIATSSPR